MMAPPINPYAAPRADSLDPPLQGLRIDYYEEDGCLVVRDGSRLPALCVRYGEPAEGELKTRTVRHVPTWTIWTFIVFSPLIGILLMLALQRTYRVTFAISERARARRRLGLLIGFGALVAAIATIYAAATLGEGMLILLGIVGVWVGIFLTLTNGQPYRVRKASGDYVYLQLHADALYEFERYKQQHQPAPEPVAVRQVNPHSPF